MKIETPQTTAFDFQGRNIRTLHIHGQPWFVGKDVCDTLGIKQATRAVESLHDTEKDVTTIHTLGGPQQMIVVNESGLYALIFQSRKPQAVRFRRWITAEVLPALRKTGFYALTVDSLQDKADWELSRSRGRLALLRELRDLERDPKCGVEYLTIAQFLERQGVKLEKRTEILQFARQLQMACRELGEYPVKQYRRRNRIPSTLWPEPILRQSMSWLPPSTQALLPLN